jgi:NADPH-dependent 2,4-dienoyl-CoA reductase/sulfur reductase-like enzyme
LNSQLRRLPPDQRLFAVVGAGAAGAFAAQTLRQSGFDGRIVMLDRENRVSYDRTLLSKYHLSGEAGADPAAVAVLLPPTAH